MGSSNPCLTVLLVYSALCTIALIITGSLLGTTHTNVTCTGGGDTGVQVTHYAIVDESQDSVEGDKTEELSKSKCHCNHTCNCKNEKFVTAVEIFLLTCVSLLVLALTIYTCIAIRVIILKRKKMVKQKKVDEQERVRKETEQREIEKRREWVRDAIELGALPAQTSKGLAKPVPKDLE